MKRAAFALFLWAVAMLLAGCGDDDNQPGVGDVPVADGGMAGEAGPRQPVQSSPDAAPVLPPVITAIKPDHGPSMGGNWVVLEGANFATGATVYIDGGADILGQVSVTPPIRIAFAMPRNPYGIERASEVEVMVLCNGELSNRVKYQYEAQGE